MGQSSGNSLSTPFPIWHTPTRISVRKQVSKQTEDGDVEQARKTVKEMESCSTLTDFSSSFPLFSCWSVGECWSGLESSACACVALSQVHAEQKGPTTKPQRWMTATAMLCRMWFFIVDSINGERILQNYDLLMGTKATHNSAGCCLYL